MNQYKLQGKKGDGAFSQVFKARSIKTKKCVAIKCMKKKFDNLDKVRKLREIRALKLLYPHQNIVKLNQILYDEPSGKLALVFQLMDLNLYECIRSRKLSLIKMRFYLWQLLRAIQHTHKNGIFHRDIKPQNVLLLGQQVKLADFGSCQGIYINPPHTQYISTRWYRAPECLMTDGFYDQKMDIWGYGCVFFQFLSHIPLFPGKNQPDQVNKINQILGTPPQYLVDKFKKNSVRVSVSLDFQQRQGYGIQKLCPTLPPDALDLLYKLMAYDPQQRISANDALKHDFFKQVYQKFDASPYSISKSQDKQYSNQKIKFNKKNKIQTKKKDDQMILPPINNIQVDMNMKFNFGTEKFKKTGNMAMTNTKNKGGASYFGLQTKKILM